jgi:hypothetical protein
LYWPSYESSQRKYLWLALKPKVRDHFHSHRLSYWHHLLPQLQRPPDTYQNELPVAIAKSFSTSGSSSTSATVAATAASLTQLQRVLYARHHLLTDHQRADTYDGPVRPLGFDLTADQWKWSQPDLDFRFPFSSLRSASASFDSTLSNSASSSAQFARHHPPPSPDSVSLGHVNDNSHNQRTNPHTAGQSNALPRNATGTSGSSAGSARTFDNAFTFALNKLSSSSNDSSPNALQLTIACGVGLLLINLAIFVVVYRQLHRARSAAAAVAAAAGTSVSSMSHLNGSSSGRSGDSVIHGSYQATLRRRPSKRSLLHDPDSRNSATSDLQHGITSGSLYKQPPSDSCEQCEVSHFCLVFRPTCNTFVMFNSQFIRMCSVYEARVDAVIYKNSKSSIDLFSPSLP